MFVPHVLLELLWEPYTMRIPSVFGVDWVNRHHQEPLYVLIVQLEHIKILPMPIISVERAVNVQLEPT